MRSSESARIDEAKATSTTPDPRLSRVRAIATMLDSAIGIPGTSVRFGLDPILGLVPGLGDLASAALSGYIVLAGIKMGVPRPLVIRMIANVAFDTVVGSVPLLGDLFDAGWKSNMRNVSLLERHFAVERIPGKGSRLGLAAGVVALVLLASAGIAGAFFLLRWIFHLLQ